MAETVLVTGGSGFLAADLTSDDGWKEAVAGCDYVLHVASPFPPVQPEGPRRADRAGAGRNAARTGCGARDVAALQVNAMSAPEAGGQRFIAVAEFRWMAEVAATLRRELG